MHHTQHHRMLGNTEHNFPAQLPLPPLLPCGSSEVSVSKNKRGSNPGGRIPLTHLTIPTTCPLNILQFSPWMRERKYYHWDWSREAKLPSQGKLGDQLSLFQLFFGLLFLPGWPFSQPPFPSPHAIPWVPNSNSITSERKYRKSNPKAKRSPILPAHRYPLQGDS